MILALEFNINSEPVKYLIVALTFPIWLPFVKALYEEFNDALREEGGLFGAAPTEEELAVMRKRSRSGQISAFVSEPKDAFADRENPEDAQDDAARLQGRGGGRSPGFGARDSDRGGATRGFRS